MIQRQRMRKIRLLGYLCASVLLASCGGGGGGQGSGPAAGERVSLSGTAAKGLMRKATVTVHEIVDGAVATTALATTTTGSDGRYTLSVPSTSRPVLIKVSATDETTMLDETQFVDGQFREVRAPAGLTMRSFAPALAEAAVVHVNPLTEAALQIASNASNAGGSPGLSKNTLLAAMQVAIQLAPPGVNPFLESPPASPAAMSNEQARLAVFMAGLMASASGDCDVTCRVSGLGSGIRISVAPDGAARIEDTAAVQAKRTAILETGRSALVSAAGASGAPANMRSVLDAATAVVAAAKSTPIADATLPAAAYEATLGFEGFVTAMRRGFAAAEASLRETSSALVARYEEASIQGANGLSSAVAAAIGNCGFNGSGVFSCWSGGRVSWVAVHGSVGTYRAVAWGDNGRRVELTASGSDISGSRTLLVSGVVRANWLPTSAVVAELKDIRITVLQQGDDNAPITAKLDGQVVVHDQAPGSSLRFALVVRDVNLSDDATGTSASGGLALEVSNGDVLRGALGLRTSKLSAGGVVFNEPVFASIDLAAESRGSSVASLGASMERTPRPVLAASEQTPDNFDRLAIRARVGLPNAVSIGVGSDLSTWSTVNATLTVQSGGSEFTMSAPFTTDVARSDSTWCVQVQDIPRCTGSLSLRSKDGLYAARLARTGGGVSGDIYRNDLLVGKLVNGVLQIDGRYVSLY